jgi:hypothetical protein
MCSPATARRIMPDDLTSAAVRLRGRPRGFI